jgi:hypothetical protein
MKRFVTTILLVTYFLVSSGFAVNLHYCMNKFHSWELGASDEDSCNKCGMNTSKSNGCCRDEVKVVKLEQDSVKAFAIAYQVALPAIISPIPSYFLLPVQGQTISNDHRINGPPIQSKQDTYLYNCVFRL